MLYLWTYSRPKMHRSIGKNQDADIAVMTLTDDNDIYGQHETAACSDTARHRLKIARHQSRDMLLCDMYGFL